MKNRREFIRTAGAGILAAGVAPSVILPSAAESEAGKQERKPDIFSIGMAGYSFYNLPFEKGVEIMKRVNVLNMSLKDNYLPLTSDKAKIEEVMGRFKAAGINIYTAGVITMEKAEDIDRAFAYASAAGLKMIVGQPAPDILKLVEEKVKQYDIRIAMHNHGPDTKNFPTADVIWEKIKDMDSRMGICLDIGHTTRAGRNPVADLQKYAVRIFDIHIKDVTAATKEGKTIEMGRGIIDIPGFVKALRKVKYTGMCSLEFEKDMNDPLGGIAESIGYFKGVCAAVR
jgi:inosose dehydratase